MNSWSAPQRPNTYVEQMLLSAILDGTFAPGSTLPGERTLAAELGVTRPTLREAIQRLARDGWLTVRQGKSTVVNDYWRDGGLNVLNALVNHGQHLPEGFVTNLLEVRLQLAPAYTREAVAHQAEVVVEFLNGRKSLLDEADSFADFDWRLHRRLTLSSGNPIYTLILNGFGDFYSQLARIYFKPAAARARSRSFYDALACAAEDGDALLAEKISRDTMLESIKIWQRVREFSKHFGSLPVGPGSRKFPG
jgi:GntR family negative regulator for fad regulon and positive regulator of fabA